MSGMAAMLRSGAGDRVGSAQSPTLLSRVQSRLSSPMRSPSNTSNRILNNESSYYEDKPQMHVSIVLEHLWTEPVAPSGQNQNKEIFQRAQYYCWIMIMLLHIAGKHTYEQNQKKFVCQKTSQKIEIFPP